MGKKRKQGKQPAIRQAPLAEGVTVQALPPMPMNGLLQALGMQPALPTFAEIVGRSAKGEHTERLWSVEASRDCCGAAAHDGVIVSIPKADAEAEAVEAGGDPSMRRISITAIDLHPGSSGSRSAILDVEDVKQLVNQLSEAIAYVEARVAS